MSPRDCQETRWPNSSSPSSPRSSWLDKQIRRGEGGRDWEKKIRATILGTEVANWFSNMLGTGAFSYLDWSVASVIRGLPFRVPCGVLRLTSKYIWDGSRSYRTHVLPIIPRISWFTRSFIDCTCDTFERKLASCLGDGTSVSKMGFQVRRHLWCKDFIFKRVVGYVCYYGTSGMIQKCSNKYFVGSA